MHTTSDIIIVGGGVVGLTLALALLKTTSLSITVIARRDVARFQRVSAITLASQRIFKKCNAWDAMVQHEVSPFTEIEVWDESGKGEIQFDSQDIAEPFLGYIIDNHVMQSALKEQLQNYTAIKLYEDLHLTACIENADGILLESEQEASFSAPLVVGSDGAHSWLRSKAGIALAVQDYEQEAIVSTLSLSRSHERIARQCFLKSGPIACLPLADEHTASLVWSLPKEKAKIIMSLEHDAFCEALTHAFSRRIGEVTDATPRYAFALEKQEARQYIKPHIVLIGDAAHTVHPLAGQGVNMGLLDAASLSEVIEEAILHRRDFAAFSTLRRYERWRKADNLQLLKGIDWIKHFYENEHPWVKGLRTWGLNTINQLPIVKNRLIQYAVGNRAGLPKLAQ